MRTIKAWLAARRQRRSDELQARGFDYAAGCLLRGEDPDEIDARIIHHDFNAFDLGILQAIRQWQRTVPRA